MDVYTRRLVGFGVERANVDGISVCRMFNRAIAGQRLPKRVSTDHDPLFRFHRWLANLRVLAIEEVKSVPYAPVSHPFIERLIGTVRRVRVEDWRADLRLRWLFHGFHRGPQSGCHRHVSSPRRFERSVRVSRTTLTCLLRTTGYETYLAESAFRR
jgi:hypothetical protein